MGHLEHYLFRVAVMNSNESEQLTPIIEGGEAIVQELSEYLHSLEIQNSVTLAEDCKPGS